MKSLNLINEDFNYRCLLDGQNIRDLGFNGNLIRRETFYNNLLYVENIIIFKSLEKLKILKDVGISNISNLDYIYIVYQASQDNLFSINGIVIKLGLPPTLSFRTLNILEDEFIFFQEKILQFEFKSQTRIMKHNELHGFYTDLEDDDNVYDIVITCLNLLMNTNDYTTYDD